MSEPASASLLPARLRAAALMGPLGCLISAAYALLASLYMPAAVSLLVAIAALFAPLSMLRHRRYAEVAVYLMLAGLAGLLVLGSAVQAAGASLAWPYLALLLPLTALIAPLRRAVVLATLLVGCGVAAATLLAPHTAGSLTPEAAIRQLLMPCAALIALGASLAALLPSSAIATRNSAEQTLRAEHDRQQALLGFIRFIQHELRSYAAALEGLAPLIRDQLLDDRKDRAVDTVSLIQDFSQTVAQLNSLVQQVYILTRQETLAIEQRRMLSLLPLLRQAKRDAEAYALQQQLPLTVVLDPASDLHVHGDALCLSLALITALRNAADAFAEVADPGQPQEPIVTVRAFHDQNAVVVRVEDSGPGFPWHLLERFAQHRFGWSTKVGGSGVGLAILDQVARLHGGLLRLGNRSDRSGAWIELVFPRAGANLGPSPARVRPTGRGRFLRRGGLH